MSQKLDNLKKDFESKFNNELKQDLLKLFSCSQEFILSTRRFLEENISTLEEIENEMCGKGNDGCCLFKDYIGHIVTDDKDIENAMEQLLDSMKPVTAIKDSNDSLDIDNLYYALENSESSIF